MKNGKKRMTRRAFLLKGGVAAVTALAASVSASSAEKPSKKKASPPAPDTATAVMNEPPVSYSSVDLNLTVNGAKRQMTVPAGRMLSEVLRQDMGLTGIKLGCGRAECGSCTVLVNNRPVYSCVYPAVLADQSVVETIEGVGPAAGGLHPLQKAFIEKDALQCGFCTPGMICSAKALLVRNPQPGVEDIRDGLSGNLCRCGAYENIVEAVRSVSKAGT